MKTPRWTNVVGMPSEPMYSSTMALLSKWRMPVILPSVTNR